MLRIPLIALLAALGSSLCAQPVQYWDGTNVIGNNQVDGGTGSWGESSNWTNESGSVNSTWMSGIAVFQGSPGTVTLTVPSTVQGMRFHVDGYSINGLFIDNTLATLAIDVDADVTATINTMLVGSEGLIKNGDGTLILGAADNDFAGNVVLNGGVLRVMSDAALGDGSMVTLNGGLLGSGDNFTTARAFVIDEGGGGFAPGAGTVLTFNGVISGSGGLTVDGPGTLILGGDNSYTGGTTIEQGSVRTNSSGALGGGDLEVNGGAIVLGADLDISSLRGNGGEIDLAGGDLNIGQASDGTFEGNIVGAGGIVKAGGGTLVLTGDNTYRGGTSITGGTLAGTLNSIRGDIANNGVLELRDSGEVDLNQEISGSGDVVFAGDGVIDVKKDQTYTGKTTIQSGTLLVNADIASDEVVIGEGGTIGGSGILKGDLDNMGTLSPGNSPGTLRINGDMTLAGGSRTQIEVASRTSFDRIIVRRTARLNGELEVLLLGGFEPDQGDTFRIITARRVLGRFSSEDLPASTQFDVVYGPRAVDLVVAGGRIPYPVFARTPNQFETAVALETLRTRDLGTGSDFDRNVRTVLDILPAPELRGAFEEITPSQSIAFAQSVFAISRVWLPQMATRLADIRGGSRGFVSSGFNERGASDMKDVLAPVVENKWGVWVDGSGVFSETASFDGLRTGDASSGQASIGVDYRVNDNFTVGFYTGYIGTWTNFGGGSNVDSNGTRFGIYSTYQTGGFYLNSVIGGEWNAYDWNRSIRFPGINRRATADTEGTVFETLFGGGYDWKLSECLSIGAFTSLEYTLLNVDGFTESGARSLDLRINDQDADSLRTNLGVQVAGSIPIGTKFLRPSVRAAWRHEYLDGSRNITSSLAGGTGPAFSTNLPGGNRSDSLLINGGVSMDLIDNVTGYLYYTGDIAGTATENIHAINAGLRVAF